ncbi:hypothetical protein BDV39DRAFT_46596 [Aspergillus sergii]|uniref:Uncharacterized protein n=1 Tax=Aspergillus sergii TaxID=1034303 RepID=A0A5N6X8V7_9EURO|nr:hypothetical protein BDV39DRAFT_46596 [Aspergillus sergii]
MWHRHHVTSMALPTTIYCLWLISSKLACCLMTPIVAKRDIYDGQRSQRTFATISVLSGGISFCLTLTFTKMQAIYLSLNLETQSLLFQVKGKEPSNGKFSDRRHWMVANQANGDRGSKRIVYMFGKT